MRTELLSLLWSTDNKAIVCSIIDTHTLTRTEWTIVFQNRGTVRSTDVLVQARAWHKDGVRKRRRQGVRRGRMEGERMEGGERVHVDG